MKTPLTASSATDCKETPLLFQDLGSRQVVADFSGGTLSIDGGVLLLREVDGRPGLTHSLAQCFGDERQQVFVDHSVAQLLAQRIYGLALGYEDVNPVAQRAITSAGFLQIGGALSRGLLKSLRDNIHLPIGDIIHQFI